MSNEIQSDAQSEVARRAQLANAQDDVVMEHRAADAAGDDDSQRQDRITDSQQRVDELAAQAPEVKDHKEVEAPAPSTEEATPTE